MLKTGDILFNAGKSWYSGIIKKVTGGKMSHVGLMYTRYTVFETDAAWGKAAFHDVKKYRDQDTKFLRLKRMTDQYRIEVCKYCELHEGAPYSFWDILVNLLAAPLPKKWRRSLTEKLGNTTFMKCDELTQRVIWEAAAYTPFMRYEATNPAELYKKCVASGDFEEVEI